MKPVQYKGHMIEVRREGWARDADGEQAIEYSVWIDGRRRWTCVPVPYAPAIFESTLEQAQEIIDEMH